VVARTPAARRVLVFEGDAARWRPPGFEVIAQRGDGLEQRLAAAFEDVGQTALLVGMDTPQLSTELLLDGLAALTRPGSTRSSDRRSTAAIGASGSSTGQARQSRRGTCSSGCR